MNTIIIALLLVTSGLVKAKETPRKSRAPQSQRIQYKEPDGLNVNLNLFAPDPLWRSRTPPRYEVKEEAPKEAESPSTPATPRVVYEENFNYKPFESAPDHIKQLIYDTYGSQQPYVNPQAFFYQNYIGVPHDFLTGGSSENQRAVDEGQEKEKADERNSEINHFGLASAPSIAYGTAYHQKSGANDRDSSNLGGIRYKNQEKSGSAEYNPGKRPLFSPRFEQAKRSPKSESAQYEAEEKREQEREQELEEDQKSHMPMPIQTLLHYQSQIPYNVLANNIAFKAKKPFIPQPLPADARSSGHYPSKIYYIKSDGEILDELPTMGVPGGEVKYKDA